MAARPDSPPTCPERARAVIDAVGLAALIGLAGFALFADEHGSGLYRGGFLAVAVLSVVAVAAAAHPAAGLGRALGCAPLVWIGVRSYSIYLWHWPVVALTRPRLDVPLHGLPLLVLRVGLTLLLAEASFRSIERPFRARPRPARLPRHACGAPTPDRGAGAGGAVACWVAVAAVTAPVADVSLVSAAGSATTLATWPSTTASTTSTTAAPIDDGTAGAGSHRATHTGGHRRRAPRPSRRSRRGPSLPSATR